MTDVTRTVMAIVAEKSLLDVNSLSPDTKIADLGIDSLALVEIIFSIEEAFDIQIPIDTGNSVEKSFDLTSIASVSAKVAALVAQKAA